MGARFLSSTGLGSGNLIGQAQFLVAQCSAVGARFLSSTGLGSGNLIGQAQFLVAQCSATPASVAATPPCSATPFQTQISVRHLPAQGGGRCDTKILRGCSATPVLHLQNAIKSRKSAATRVARQGVPAIVCN